MMLSLSASETKMRNDKPVLLEHSFFCVKYSVGHFLLHCFCDIVLTNFVSA